MGKRLLPAKRPGALPFPTPFPSLSRPRASRPDAHPRAKVPQSLVASQSTSPGHALPCKPRVVSSAHLNEKRTARGVGYPTRRLFPKAERDGLRRVARPKGRGVTLSAGGASGSELIARWRVHRAFAREHGDATERGNGGRGRRRGNAVSHNAPAFPCTECSSSNKLE